MHCMLYTYTRTVRLSYLFVYLYLRVDSNDCAHCAILSKIEPNVEKVRYAVRMSRKFIRFSCSSCWCSSSSPARSWYRSSSPFLVYCIVRGCGAISRRVRFFFVLCCAVLFCFVVLVVCFVSTLWLRYAARTLSSTKL